MAGSAAYGGILLTDLALKRLIERGHAEPASMFIFKPSALENAIKSNLG
ncbi:hypothetical protein AcetOrient_orf04152 [Acetobacter orientalis]|uniref:Uncharacterized protein n=1 Tax=Acetobacter orientalis TaxID=146474 RepID=A0A2Z5ZJS0_9PROT|nr:hypothetical protein AcetOrient_orf04152 [Acetobacter orientalis]